MPLNDNLFLDYWVNVGAGNSLSGCYSVTNEVMDEIGLWSYFILTYMTFRVLKVTLEIGSPRTQALLSWPLAGSCCKDLL